MRSTAQVDLHSLLRAGASRRRLGDGRAQAAPPLGTGPAAPDAAAAPAAGAAGTACTIRRVSKPAPKVLQHYTPCGHARPGEAAPAQAREETRGRNLWHQTNPL